MNISVVIPAYNREKTIERCLSSVLNQTYRPLEIIVVDDGSNDDTIKKINDMNNDSIRIIQQTHLGAQAARNRGIKEAKGDYIAFLDSDDEWLPEKLDLQMRLMEEKKDRVVTTNCYMMKETSNIYSSDIDTFGLSYRVKGKNLCEGGVGNGRVYKKLLSGGNALFQGILTSKDALVKIGYLDENVPAFQEWDTSIRLAKYYEFRHVREPLFIYYIHGDETISKDHNRDIAGKGYVISKHRDEIIKECGKETLVALYDYMMTKCVNYNSKKYLSYFMMWYYSGFGGKR